eukprot:3941620-Rhodomonas_salina.3
MSGTEVGRMVVPDGVVPATRPPPPRVPPQLRHARTDVGYAATHSLRTSSTEVGYAATRRLLLGYRDSLKTLSLLLSLTITLLLLLFYGPMPLRACYAEFSTETAISLRACYVLSGTDLVHAAISLRSCCAMSGTDLAYAATYACPTQCPEEWYALGPISLRACYAMSGTDLAHGTISLRVAISLRACYAISATDLAHHDGTISRRYPISLRACYALSGTDVAYAAMCRRACYTRYLQY